MEWIRRLLWRRRYQDLSVSIQKHLEDKIDELMEEGMPREEALHAARRAFGNVSLIENAAAKNGSGRSWTGFGPT